MCCVYNDRIIVSGACYNANASSDYICIYAIQLVPPYTVKILSRIPEPRRELTAAHGSQIFGYKPQKCYAV